MVFYKRSTCLSPPPLDHGNLLFPWVIFHKLLQVIHKSLRLLGPFIQDRWPRYQEHRFFLIFFSPEFLVFHYLLGFKSTFKYVAGNIYIPILKICPFLWAYPIWNGKYTEKRLASLQFPPFLSGLENYNRFAHVAGKQPKSHKPWEIYTGSEREHNQESNINF